MDNKNTTYLPCRICGTSAHVPPVVNGHDHQHHQVSCNECGIDVCRLSQTEARDVWNKLMGLNNNEHNNCPINVLHAMKNYILFIITGWTILPK